MCNNYDPQTLEPRWQAYWEENKAFKTMDPGDPGFDPSAPKYYILDMFPYPSGAGLHVGHPTGYIATDVIARRKRMEGFNVLHPMGFDAFGLPAEQYAIECGLHPKETTRTNIDNYRRQLQEIGLSYDWTREFSTADPKFYRWTQWIFKRIYEMGLAYQAEAPVWWCEDLKTVLANEEVINGRSERGDFPCERRMLRQWMLRITSYADRLIDDLDDLDWPESVKTMQREWIGRSYGANAKFEIVGREDSRSIEVFTTRPDTIFGATFLAISPEHPISLEITTPEQLEVVQAYIQAASQKSDLERTDLAQVQTGVFTGAYCRNPLATEGMTGAKIPIYVADYVLPGYGTGAVMGVPAHDERDFAFAKRYALEVIRVVDQENSDDVGCFTGDGVAINSPPLDGLRTPDAKRRVIELLTVSESGSEAISYRLRDWLFSRQRYWGEPFPLLHGSDGSTIPVDDSDLPVVLPEMSDFTPGTDGSAPLGRVEDWVRVASDGSSTSMHRETDTMPGWAGSSWYYLRFMDPHNDNAPWSSGAEKYWGPVDLYVGGMEHAVLHLLYARFWHKILFDLGIVTSKEPFTRLFNQGMVVTSAFRDQSGRLVPTTEAEFDGDDVRSNRTGEPLEKTTAKMSKSLKNVVNPDDVIAEYGRDTFRLYELFMGPLADSKHWNPRDIPGCRRFLDRVWRLFVDDKVDQPVRLHLQDSSESNAPDSDLERGLNVMLKRIDDAFSSFKFNTAIAAMMSFVNQATSSKKLLTSHQAERFLLSLAPFAPHIAEELWSRIGKSKPLAKTPWPKVDANFLVGDEFELVVQIMGKVRGRTNAPRSLSKDELISMARSIVADNLKGKRVVREIVVPGRLVNFVVE